MITIKDDKQLGFVRSKVAGTKDPKLRAELEDAIARYEAIAAAPVISLEGPKPGPPIEEPPPQVVPVQPTTQDVVDPERRAIQGALGFPLTFDSPDAFAVPPPAQGTRTGTTSAFRVEPGQTEMVGAPRPGTDDMTTLPQGARWLPEGDGAEFDQTARGVQRGQGTELARLEAALNAGNKAAAEAAGVEGVEIGPDGRPRVKASRGLPKDPFHDEGVPNLSKDVRFYTPPVSTAGSSAGRVLHLEPSQEYARALLANSPALRTQIGMAPDQELPERLTADVYNRVADRLYERVYERAVTEGKQVYRYSQLEKYLDPVENRWAFAATNAAIPVTQAALWFEEEAMLGLGSAAMTLAGSMVTAEPSSDGMPGQRLSGPGQAFADTRAELMESTPEGLAAGAGLAGALMPWGAPTRAAKAGVQGARALGKATPMFARMASSPVGRFAGRVAEGAAGGAAVGVGTAVGKGLSGEVERQFRSDQFRTPEEQGIQGIFDNAVAGGIGGGLFGAAMSPFADVAGSAVRMLRGNNQALYGLEKAGGQQDFIVTRVNKDIWDALKKYRNAAKDEHVPRVIDQLTDDAFGPVMRRAKEYGTDTIVREGQMKERYYLSPAGRQKKVPQALFDQAWSESVGVKKSVTDPDFYRLSTEAAKKAATKLSEPVWLQATPGPNGTMRPVKKPKGVVIKTPAEMRAVLGDDWMQEAQQLNPGGGAILGVKARPMTARAFDELAGSLDDATKRSKKGPQSTQGETPEFLARMARAAHLDREQWKGNQGKTPDPWSTWAEGMRGASGRLAEAEKRLGHMGVEFATEAKGFERPLTAMEETVVKAKIRSYLQQESGGGQDVDLAFDFVVNNPAERQRLLNVAQYLAAQRLKGAKVEAYGGTNIKGGTGAAVSGLGPFVRDRMAYPVAKGLAGSADSWYPKEGRLDLSPKILAWIDAYMTHGTINLGGGMPARAMEPLDALELLTETALQISKSAYESGKAKVVETAEGAFGRPAAPVVRERQAEPEEEEYEP